MCVHNSLSNNQCCINKHTQEERDAWKHVYTRDNDHNFLAAISSARVEIPVSLSVLMSDSHVRGNPFPSIHSCSIFCVILSGFPLKASSMVLTRVPISSLRRKIPNVK